MVRRLASIDVGTNTVHLLVAEVYAGGQLAAVLERQRVTRLGQGVDATGQLAESSMARTASTIAELAEEARALGASKIIGVATSAARDARNSETFVARVAAVAGVEVQILSGEVEASLTFRAASEGLGDGVAPLAMVDVGGGSTEVVFGARDRPVFRHSVNVGSVRLTERFLHGDPPTAEELSALKGHVRGVFAQLPKPQHGTRVVSVGTATTLYAVVNALGAEEAMTLHGERLQLAELRSLEDRVCALRTDERSRLSGVLPGRADILCASAILVTEALASLGADETFVTDRGLRYGVLLQVLSRL